MGYPSEFFNNEMLQAATLIEELIKMLETFDADLLKRDTEKIAQAKIFVRGVKERMP